MNYIKNSLINTYEFLKDADDYFKNVILANVFIMAIILPFLRSVTRLILRQGEIEYISYDNIPTIIHDHRGVLAALIAILLLIVFIVFFEFTFLLLSVYFIRVRQPVGLKQLLWMTTLQIKKVRLSTVLFFLFYFLLILPLGGLGFHSDILSKIKIPAFIMDFIFDNRLYIVILAVLSYLFLLFIGIRVIFALPEMILRDRPFKKAVAESWRATRYRFLAILGQFIFIGGTLIVIFSASSFLIIQFQKLVEEHAYHYAFPSAVLMMVLLQMLYLGNSVLSTVVIFYIIIDYMDDSGFLPEIPKWFYLEFGGKKNKLSRGIVFLAVVLFVTGVGVYDINYLRSAETSIPLTISHRGVSNKNGVQNTLPALKRTAESFHPDYVEMDVQETKDHQFIVMHDFNLRYLTGVNKRPGELTLKQLSKLTAKENNQTAKVPTFDAYLAAAKKLNQRLLIEIKTEDNDNQKMVARFLELYLPQIRQEEHQIQCMDHQIIEQIKKAAPDVKVGYILPFNVVGPPKSSADFLTMEYSTINRNFIDSALSDGKQVYVWTVNSEDAMSRMQFYGADGIITDQMKILNNTLYKDQELTYSDKLLNFVIGIG